MATTTSISRRTVTIKGKNAKLPKATPSATGFSQRRDSLSYPTSTLKPPPRRIKKWWQKSEVLFALALAGFVIGGLTYLGVTAKPTTGEYQDDYFVSGGTYGDTNGTEGRNRGNSSSQDKVTNAESFLSFARTQRLRNEASRASHAARQAR